MEAPKFLTQKDFDKVPIWNDRRVMLSLDIDDIKGKCKEMKVSQRDIDFDKVFYITRKNIENSMMDGFWDCLEYAIQESYKE